MQDKKYSFITAKPSRRKSNSKCNAQGQNTLLKKYRGYRSDTNVMLRDRKPFRRSTNGIAKGANVMLGDGMMLRRNTNGIKEGQYVMLKVRISSKRSTAKPGIRRP